MYFYALYSKSKERYCAPFLAPDDKEAISQISSAVTGSQDPGLIMSLDDLRLDKVGSFLPDAFFPVREAVVASAVLTDLHKNLPLPPLVKDKVDQLYKDKEVDNE